jgi:prepilin-type N-terminal cleavage/methylation domain-containing protein
MRLVSSQKGTTLIEVLIAIALLGLIAVPFLTALSTSSRGVIIADERTTAESLVRSEMEYVKNCDYHSTGFSYEVPPTANNTPWGGFHALDDRYAGYSVNVTGVPIDPDTGEALSSGDKNIQNITVRVYHWGEDEPVLTTSTYKIR